MKISFKATAMLFATAMIWGFAFVAQVLGGDHLGSFTFNALRWLLGGLCLIPVYLLFEKKKTGGASEKCKHACFFARLALSLPHAIQITTFIGEISAIDGAHLHTSPA
jgi:drug/metabolite transporter (DMT)-like permease